MKSLLVVVSLILSAQHASSQSNLKPLLFSAEKNNLQILPQRFEYTLVNDDTFKIGDILIDTNHLSYDIKRTDDGAELSFSWPGTLIEDGVLSIKDNSGKALYTTRVQPELITVTNLVSEQSDSLSRSSVAKFTVKVSDKNLFESLQHTSFTVFCLDRQTVGAKIYLCSKELFLSQESGQTKIKSRSAQLPKAQITVNGKELSEQGMIYLNSRDEDVFFKARSKTGAFLEIETRKQDITFKDFYVGKSGNEILVIGEGAAPVSNKRIRMLEDGMWQAALAVERPFIYVMGDGNIPLRQEFYIKSAIPKSQYRPFLSKDSPSQTYASRLTLNGFKPAAVQVKSEPKAQDQISLDKNQFTWTVENLQAGSENQKNLGVTAGQNSFVASYNITRGYRFLADADLIAQTSPSQIAGKFGIQTWLDLHWGFAVNIQSMLAKTNNRADLAKIGAEFLWRRHAGLNMINPSWGAYLEFASLQGSTERSSAIGVGVTYSLKNLFWTDWVDTRLGFSSAKLGDTDLSGLVLKAKAYQQITRQFFWSYSFGLEPGLNTNGESILTPLVGSGLSYQF